jgi:hypothetical protein
MTSNEFNKKIFQLLSRVEFLTGQQLDDAFRRIELLIKHNFKEPNSKDVWYKNDVLKKQIEKELQQATGRIVKLTENGITGIWELANQRSDEIVFSQLLKVTGLTVAADKVYNFFNRVLPKNLKPGEKMKITEKTLNEVISNPRRDEALQAFLKRKTEALNLSARVWKLSDEQILPLIESRLAEGIASGKSAAEISRNLKPYLENPNALFRRVRDVKTGKLKLSIAAKKYEPGQGVYRSASKNAKRLAASEVNFAYRSADHERWEKLDFITGIQVKRSNSNKGPCDLCDPLAGTPPKEFRFIGWHPWCICFATPDLLDEEAFIGQLTGEPVEIPELPMPEGFQAWIKDHAEYLEKTDSPPYFVKYNQQIVSDIIEKESKV